MFPMSHVVPVVALAAALFLSAAHGQEKLRDLKTDVIPADEAKTKQLAQMTSQDARNRIRAANQRETAAWRAVKTRADWERLRDVRITALRDSLGQVPPVPKDLKVQVTRRLEGDGYRIENLVFESRPGLLVTANLYLPAKPPEAMPGILIVHSHHNPKTQGELQDMGMTWARQGCLVLVMDQFGHGERRQHPFVNEKSYPGTFRPTRQDYYFRYNSAMQLHLIGDSLMGWMAWDLMRGVDLLLGRPGIDRERIILLGAVAGGGDPAAVTGALDPRITVVGPFNFGGPQPETTYPLPADADNTFNYAGGGSWESTRNLRLSARDGFLPWVIVGAVAPRRLIYGHEFAWDREHDPVWARLETIHGFYDTKDRLTAAIGRGRLSGQPPESSHCNNIGAIHRVPIHAALQRWFNMMPPEEYQKRRPADELLCLTDQARPRPLHELATEIGAERAAAARKGRAGLAPEARRERLRQDWTRLLGDVEPKAAPRVTVSSDQEVDGVTVKRIALEVEPNIVVPLMLLLPPRQDKGKPPVVLGVAQDGKRGFLNRRTQTVADLLRGGAAVCLPDLRGTGETRPGDGRGRSSSATSISSSELMLGRTMLGLRLRDLRSVLQHLRGREDVDAGRVALWGDSFAPVNAEGRSLEVPWDADRLPDQAEPLGGLLALLGALFEKDVRAVYARGGLSAYQAVLESPFCYVPHDAIIPGALTAGDLCDVAAALAPRPLRLEGLVDGRNRRVPVMAVAAAYAPTREAYDAVKARGRFEIEVTPSAEAAVASWLLAKLKTDGF